MDKGGRQDDTRLSISCSNISASARRWYFADNCETRQGWDYFRGDTLYHLVTPTGILACPELPSLLGPKPLVPDSETNELK